MSCSEIFNLSLSAAGPLFTASALTGWNYSTSCYRVASSNLSDSVTKFLKNQNLHARKRHTKDTFIHFLHLLLLLGLWIASAHLQSLCERLVHWYKLQVHHRETNKTGLLYTSGSSKHCRSILKTLLKWFFTSLPLPPSYLTVLTKTRFIVDALTTAQGCACQQWLDRSIPCTDGPAPVMSQHLVMYLQMFVTVCTLFKYFVHPSSVCSHFLQHFTS